MGFTFGNFAVFNDPRLPIFENDKADGFFGGAFADYFRCDAEIVQERVAYESWICDADKAVIYAVGVDVFDVAAVEICQHTVCDEG